METPSSFVELIFKHNLMVTLPRWPPCLYTVKTFEYHLLWNPKANGLGTLYVAFGIWAYQVCINGEYGLTLTFFTPRPKLILMHFSITVPAKIIMLARNVKPNETLVFI